MAKNEFLEEHFNFEMTGTETYYTKKNFETKEGEKLNIEIMDTGTSLGNEFESNLAKVYLYRQFFFKKPNNFFFQSGVNGQLAI